MGVVVRRYIDILIIIITFPYSTCISSFWQQHPYFFVDFKNVFSFFISKNKPDSPKMQYISNTGISRVKYTIPHFEHHHRVLQLISNGMSV